MKHFIVNFSNKFWVSFIIVALLFQSVSPTLGVAAKSNSPEDTTLNTDNFAKGTTIGSEIAPEDRMPSSPVPDFAKQVADEAKTRPAATIPLRLKVSAVPAIYTPGKPIRIQWSLDGLGDATTATSYPQLSIQVPLGVTANDPIIKSAMSVQGLLNVSESNLAGGQAEWAVGTSAKFPLTFRFSLQRDGQVIDEEDVLVDIGKFSIPASGGTINANDGDVKINVPAGAISQALSFDVRNPSPQQMPPISLTGHPVEIIAVGKTDGLDVKHFKQPISIQMKYDPEKLIHPHSQNALTMYYYDDSIADWFPLPTTVDPVTHTITAQSDHLTVYDYKANNWQTNSLPTVDAFKVSDFTGAATYGISMWTPPGPGGLQPSVSLDYNSQVIDESMAFSQASWVGMGWSLETGAITRNMHDSDNGVTDDTFNISVAGINGLLLPISFNPSTNTTTYNTADQSFASIQFNGSIWTVLGKDGTKYIFDKTAKTNSDTSKGCVNAAGLDLTWKWSLGSITNTSGKSLTYNYFNETKPGCANEIAVYPDTIVYPGGNYQVHFIRGSRNDYQDSWTKKDSRSLYGTYKLDEVSIECRNAPTVIPGSTDCRSASWTPMRRYALTYAPDNDPNVIYPGFVWTGGSSKTLTLLGVQEWNGGKSVPLPKTSFQYTDHMHVTDFNNGQGGSVSVTYQPWHYPDDLNDRLRSLFLVYGTNDGCKWKNNSWDPGILYWGSVYGPALCSNASGGPYLQLGLTPQDYPPAGYPARIQLSIPENVAKLGGHFDISIKGRSQSKTKPSLVSWKVLDTTGAGRSVGASNNNVVYNNQVPYVIQMDPTQIDIPLDFNPSKIMLQLYCEFCFISKIQFAVMPMWYRVTSRTVTDAITGRSGKYAYEYDNATPNTAYVSKAVQSAPAGASSDVYESVLYTPPLREFRGHAMTQVTDPAGLTNVTWYSQDDALKGRAYHTLTLRKPLSTTNKLPITDNFDTLDSTNWDFDSTETKLDSLQNIDYDTSAFITTTIPGWSKGLTRKNTLGNGQMAVAQFRLSGDTKNARAQVGLVNGTKFFGLIIQPNSRTNGQATAYQQNLDGTASSISLMSGNFELGKWYVVELFVDNINGMRLRIWQEDNPSVSDEFTVSTPTSTTPWTFHAQAGNLSAGNTSTLGLDTYFEGQPFAESDTNYKTKSQYDHTTLLKNASVNLSAYLDLGINWNNVNNSSQRTYNGDASFAGTKSDYVYAPVAQYGNLINQTDFSWNGSNWIAYRGTKTEFHPNVGANIVSLPARQITVPCSGTACNFANESNKVAETLYFYDGNTDYTIPPGVTGRLTIQRAWAGDTRYIQTSNTYDNYGNVKVQTAYTGYASASNDPTTGKIEKTTTTYDSYNTYAVKVTNPLDNPTKGTRMDYDYAKGIPYRVKDANDATTTATYDDFGRILSIRAPGDETGPSTLTIHYNDNVRPFQIDLTQKVEAGKFIRISRFYDGLGKQIQSQTVGTYVKGVQQTIVTDSLYDELGRLTEQTVPYVSGYSPTKPPAFVPQKFKSNLIDFAQPFSKTVYDSFGRKASETQPNGDKVRTVYNDALYDIPLADGITHQITGQVIRQSVLVTTVYDPQKFATTSRTDVWGHTLSVSPSTGPGLFYAYDVLGQLTTTVKGVSATAAASTTTTLFYDKAGRKTLMNDPDMGTWTYDYDAVGNLTAQTDARSCTSNMTYDYLNRIRIKSYLNCPATSTVNYFYDVANPGEVGTFPVGHRTKMTDGSGTTLWTYDERGRTLSETKQIDDAAHTYTTLWEYNSADLPTSMTYPDGEKLTYNYNSDGSLAFLKSNLGTYASGMQYDEAARMTSLTLGANINRAFTYYPWNTPTNGGLLNTIKTTVKATPTNIPMQSLAYTYDDNGNVHSIANNGETTTFDYDTLNRLLKAQTSGGSLPAYNELFDYNASTGNLAHKGQITPLFAYTYDSSHPHAVAKVGSVATAQYGYDENGNMTERLGRTLKYDAENRLVSVTTDTDTPTVTPSKTNTSMPTPSKTITGTFTKSPTAVFTGTQTGTFTLTATNTITPTPTETVTPTETLTPAETLTPSITASETETSTATPIPDTSTPGPTPTSQGTPLAAISAGWSHTCAAKMDGTLTCWGLNDTGQASPPADSFTQISAGFDFTCGIKNDSTPACWGSNDNGQSSNIPLGTFAQFSAGSSHICGIKTDGTLACWGDNYAGQTTPPTGNFTQVSSGWAHTCAIRDDATLACWGLNSSGQATPPGGTFTQISAGWAHTCGLRTDGTLVCWGLNTSGQSTPPSGTFVQVSAGYTHSCAIRDDGTIACWGSNQDGQSIPPNGTFTQISVGSMFSCALKNDARPVCWGNDTSGQLDFVRISGNTGIAGAVLNYTDGVAKTATADGNGDYSFFVSNHWSGSVTPSLSGYTFIPDSRSYTDLQIEQTGQNYTIIATATPTETASPTDILTSTITVTVTMTTTQTNTATTTGTLTPTLTRTRTVTPSPTLTRTLTVTKTLTPTITPTRRFQPTPTLAPFTGAFYFYDGDGNMVKAKINGITTYYANRSYQVTNDGTVTKYYGSYAMRMGGKLSYLISDQLGSTSMTLDISGQKVAELRYKAFGEIRYALGNTPTDYRYTGQRQQADTGLYYYGARWYDTALGRFAQADTVIPNGVQGLDRYAYVNNSPLNGVDPSGHYCETYINGNQCVDTTGSVYPVTQTSTPTPSYPVDQNPNARMFLDAVLKHQNDLPAGFSVALLLAMGSWESGHQHGWSNSTVQGGVLQLRQESGDHYHPALYTDTPEGYEQNVVDAIATINDNYGYAQTAKNPLTYYHFLYTDTYPQNSDEITAAVTVLFYNGGTHWWDKDNSQSYWYPPTSNNQPYVSKVAGELKNYVPGYFGYSDPILVNILTSLQSVVNAYVPPLTP